MAIQTRSSIKNWFKTTLKPTQQQFWDWLDSFWHKQDEIPIASIKDLETTLNTKVDKKDIAAPEVWDELQAYVFDAEVQQYVSYQNPASANSQFQVEGFYRLLADTAAGESPETHPLKWAYQGFTLGEITIADVLGLQEELTGKIPATEKAAANGVATLGADGKVPATQLPAKPSDLSFALSDETSDLTTDNDGEIEVRRAQTLVSITFAVNVAPTGSSILCDVKKNGVSILTTPIELTATSLTVTITAPQIATTALAVGDRLKADITQIGATIPGAGAKIYPLTELT